MAKPWLSPSLLASQCSPLACAQGMESRCVELRGRAEESQQLAQEVGQCDCGMMWERESLHCCSSGSTVRMLCVCVLVSVRTYVCTYMCVYV